MDKKNYLEFGQIMTMFNETYGDPNKQVSTAKLEFYFKCLEDLSINEINTACVNLGRTKTYHTFPTPAEIREAVHGKTEDQAQIAYDKFITAVRRFGAYDTVVFDDPVIHAIIEREGGWQTVCDKTIEEMKWFSKDFVKMYIAFLPRINDMKVPEKLIGIHEHQNALKGYDEYIPDPIIIGDDKKALAWTEKKKIETKTLAILGVQ